MNAAQKQIPPTIEDNQLYLASEAAPLLRMSKRQLLVNARKGRIPCLRINERVIRFHIPSVIAARRVG